MKLAKKSKSIILFFFLALFVIACQKNKLDDETLVRIYVENIVIEESFSKDGLALSNKKQELFKKYKTTPKEYETALMNLQDDQERWSDFFKKANLLLLDLKKSGAVK